MNKVTQAMKYMKRRAKLPTGDTICEQACGRCDTPILLWNDDPAFLRKDPLICSQCRADERTMNRAIFGKKVPMRVTM